MDLIYHDAEMAAVLAANRGSTVSRVAERARLQVPPGLQDFLEALLDAAREEWADDVWRVFDENRDVKILTVCKWFLSFTFRVKHCEFLVRLIAGPRP